MAKLRKSGIVIVGVVLVAASVGYFVFDQALRDKARPAVAPSGPAGIPVTVAVAAAQDVPVYIRGLGTVQAYKTVAVKSRVDGQIVKVDFHEGQDVKEGDLLFQIDPRPYQAALDRAVAAKQRDQAQLEGAQLDLERYAKLIGPGFQSRQSYDQQKAQVDGLKAAIAGDQAAIDTAKLNLVYSDVRAPIDGRTGQRLVDLGNLVQSGQGTTLVTITEIKPIFVNFTVPQYANHNLRKTQAREALTAYAYSADDTYKLAEGKVTLVDNQIDTATGTLRLKATYENKDEQLWPGQFVSVRLQLSTRKDATTVPQRAVMQGPNGAYGYVVRADGTVERRALEVAATQDGIAVITKGVAVGEKIVADGQYRLTDGARVRVDQPTATSAPPGGQPGKSG
ncbi:MAG: efflux RND transporter periplasmic adaptor subunit [Proteobacteria bacterium]|nr:efflux RND transporter periplasmic adaptor subunit [Pseudomonadota bacterium]